MVGGSARPRQTSADGAHPQRLADAIRSVRDDDPEEFHDVEQGNEVDVGSRGKGEDEEGEEPETNARQRT